VIRASELAPAARSDCISDPKSKSSGERTPSLSSKHASLPLAVGGLLCRPRPARDYPLLIALYVDFYDSRT